jgi:hypothetical protein
MAEQRAPGRLSGPAGLFETLQSAGLEPRILSDLSERSLAEVDVIALTTTLEPHPLHELTSVVHRVRAGAGLWVCSNHGPFSLDRPDPNLVRFDQPIASSFGMTLWTATIASRRRDATGRRELSWLPVSGPIATGRPLVVGGSGLARQAVTNNGCGVLAAPWASVIVPFDDDDLVNGLDVRGVDEAGRNVYGPVPAGTSWAASVEGPATGSGRAIFCADSGWLGGEGTTWPGPGLFHLGDNRQLAANMACWLARVEPFAAGGSTTETS